MTEFISSPLFENWFKQHHPEHSMLICSPYIKQNALENIIELNKLNSRSNFDLKVLIRGNADEFTFSRSSDIGIFSTLEALPCFRPENIRRITNLHMKAYLLDGSKLLVTSGNLTNSGIFAKSRTENFEGGIFTTDRSVIESFNEYFNMIWSQSEELDVFREELVLSFSQFISSGCHSGTAGRRQRRRKYNFTPPAAAHGLPPHTSGMSFTLADLPPVCDFKYIDASVENLSSFTGGATYASFGARLRQQFGLSPENEDAFNAKINNSKFGEEKSKFLAFAGLAAISESVAGNHIFITDLGKIYLSMDNDGRKTVLREQFLSKPLIQDIAARSQDDGFNLSEYIYSLNLGTKNTVNRKISTLTSILSLLNE